MPDHRARAALLREFRKVRNMLADELAVRTLAAVGTGRRLSLVAAEMDIGRIAENIKHLGYQFAEDALGFRIRQTPVPAARLVKRLVFRLKIEHRMFRRAAAAGSGMAVGRDLRNERDAEILADRREAAHFRPGHLRLGPAPPRMLFALKHTPRLQDDIVELHQRRKSYRTLDLLFAHFRYPAQMNAAEREVRSVGNRVRRQYPACRLKGAALGDRELTERIRRPSDASERPRLDFDAVRAGGHRIRLVAGFKFQVYAPGRRVGRVLAEPFLEMVPEPNDGSRVRAVDGHCRSGVERYRSIDVALELDGHRKRRKLNRVGICLIAREKRGGKRDGRGEYCLFHGSQRLFTRGLYLAR